MSERPSFRDVLTVAGITCVLGLVFLWGYSGIVLTPVGQTPNSIWSLLAILVGALGGMAAAWATIRTFIYWMTGTDIFG